MNIYPHIPYTYLIGWSQQNKWYYGVQFGKNANPANLWSTYFTSSKPLQKFREQYGEPDIIQVRKCFYNKEAAIEWESKALKRIKSKGMFLNQAFGSVKGLIHTNEMRKKISDAGKGRDFSNRKRSFYKHKWSDEDKLRMSIQRKGTIVSDVTKAKQSAIRKGVKKKPLTEETKSKLREARSKQVITEETKAKQSAYSSSSKWITNGQKNKFCPNYDEYLDLGWWFGKTTSRVCPLPNSR